MVSPAQFVASRPSTRSPSGRVARLVDKSLVKFLLQAAGAAVIAGAVLDAAPAAAEPPPPALLPPLKKPGAPVKLEKAGPKDAAGNDSPLEHARRGVVVIEKAGQPVGLGTVLAGDGRILTALSPLGDSNGLDARYPDGSTSKLKMGHQDKAWDLALLVPQTGRWQEGLSAASKDPVRSNASLHSFSVASLGGKRQVSSAPMTVRSHKNFLGGDERVIENALELGSHVKPTDLGAPIVDEDGRVAGVMGRGCTPNDQGSCTPVAFGAPVDIIRGFLRGVPANAVAPAPWLGIQGARETEGVARGVRVVAVQPKSPADTAQLHGGDRAQSDVILAVAGTPVTSPESLADAIRSHGIGEKVPLTVFSKGKYKTVDVVLKPAPGAAPAAPVNAVQAAEPPPADGPALVQKRPPLPPTRR